MNQQVVKINKLREDATIPVYGSEYSAGADLYACIDEPVKIKKGETAFISTGISMEIPDGLVGLLFARSGLGCKRGLAPANKVGVIDSDYRGDIVVALHNHSKEEQVIEKNDKIAQMVFMPYVKGIFKEDNLTDTKRGTGGFGSTGK